MPPYACYLRKVVASGGISWHRLDDPWKASPARDLHDGWCVLIMCWPLVHSNVFPEFLRADWYHVACACFMPQHSLEPCMAPWKARSSVLSLPKSTAYSNPVQTSVSILATGGKRPGELALWPPCLVVCAPVLNLIIISVGNA